MSKFAQTPKPPYYAVLFASKRNADDAEGYSEMSDRMFALAADQTGYLGVETVSGEDGLGMTVSDWKSLDAIRNWRKDAEHKIAQKLGKEMWYEKYIIRVCLVEKEYGLQQS